MRHGAEEVDEVDEDEVDEVDELDETGGRAPSAGHTGCQSLYYQPTKCFASSLCVPTHCSAKLYNNLSQKCVCAKL